MSIQYSGTLVNTTFIPTNKQSLINNIETALLAAGWSTISGHNTTSLVMQSATTPQSLAMRIHVKDNGNTCVVVSIANPAESKVGTNSTSAGIQLNPGSSSITYRMVANPYQAFIWAPTPTPARQYGAWGVPYLPSFLSGVITEAIWAHGNACSDTDTTVREGFRVSLHTGHPGVGNVSNQQAICNGNIWESDNTPGPPNGLGSIQLLAPSNTSSDGTGCYDWHDGSANLVDALICWGLTAVSDVTKIRGQLWDAMVSSEAYTGDLTFSTTDSGGHSWIVLTDNNTGASGQLVRGTLCLATS